jgi:hypothetical protein
MLVGSDLGPIRGKRVENSTRRLVKSAQTYGRVDWLVCVHAEPVLISDTAMCLVDPRRQVKDEHASWMWIGRATADAKLGP